ncbi:GGDEF domain-containing protein [Faecalicatena contorta]|uniref:GGDEF domain-containing protein n=1 Tax=Faecalicatena contorta TaxID=39482 RepID=UPI0031D6A9C2
MQLTEVFIEAMLECAEGFYIIEEESRKICYTNSFFYEDEGSERLEGKTCCQAFAGKEEPCRYCPELGKTNSAKKSIYIWDYYDARSKHWYKVKNCLVEVEGTWYRIGNMNKIGDMMGLGSEAVKELGEMRKLDRESGELRQLLEYESYHDRLTGLYNRNRYVCDLKERFLEVQCAGTLFLDLNNLKEVNDKYFHSEGDKLLCRLADTIYKATGEAGRCYRVGGDEFIIILPDCTKEDLELLRRRIQEKLKQQESDADIPCSVAIGSAWSTSAENLESLVSEADIRMYENKRLMKDTGGIAK